MKFLAKHKKLSLLFSFLAAIIFTLGGVLLLSPRDNPVIEASATMTFDPNGGIIKKNLFEPLNYEPRDYYDYDTGYLSNYMSYVHYTHSGSMGDWYYFGFSPVQSNSDGTCPYLVSETVAILERDKYYVLHATAAYITDGSYYVSSNNLGYLGEYYSGYSLDVQLINTNAYNELYNSYDSDSYNDAYKSLINSSLSKAYYSPQTNINRASNTILFSTYGISDDHVDYYYGTVQVMPCFFAMNDSYGNVVYDDFIITDLWLYETDEYGNPVTTDAPISYTGENTNAFTNMYYHMPLPEKKGYTFLGYTTEGSTEIVGAPAQNFVGWAGYIQLDINSSNYYAQWEANTYRLELNYNCSDLSSEYISVIYDQPLPSVDDYLKHRPGYIFKGFYTQPSGGDLVYDAAGNSTLTYTEDYYTVYAQWEETWALYAQEPVFVNDAYQISSEEELAWIAWQSENGETFDGVNFVQTANIDLLGTILWCPIARSAAGKTEAPFQGNYNGNGYKISNLNTSRVMTTMSTTVTFAETTAGLFGNIKEATIENVHLLGGTVCGYYSGGIAAVAESSQISGCVNRLNIEGEVAGGIVANAMFASTISDCINQGDVVSIGATQSSYGGGIAGITTGTTEFVGLTNMGKVSGSQNAQYVGGVVGVVNDYATFTKCNNFADIGNSYSCYYSGGIVGYSTNLCIFEECLVEGNIESYVYAGGFIGGQTGGSGITSYCSYAKISLSTPLKAGGVIGHCIGDIFVANSYIQVTDVGDSGTYGAITGYQKGEIRIYDSKLVCASVITSLAGTVSSGETIYCDTAIYYAASGEKKFYKGESTASDQISSFVVINNDIFPTPLLWIENKLPIATYTSVEALGYEIVT